MNFSAIIGHERPIGILRRALENDTVAHAYLFSGDDGVGKLTVALAFAAALNCDRSGAAGGCGTCPSCRKVAARSHPDVRLLAPDGTEIKIDQVRQVQADLSLRPFEGRRKVLLVDGAEALNDASANAFLKTLEEPPGESVIILVTSMPHSLIPTIRSRCQEVRFQPLPRRLLAGVLRERRELGEQDAWFLAALSRGSIGRALDMDLEAERQARVQFAALLAGLPAMRHDELLTLADGVAKDRDGFLRLLDLGVELFRDRLVFCQTGDVQLLVFGGGMPADRACGTAPAAAIRSIDLCNESRRLLERRVSAQLVAENLFLRLRAA